MRHAEQRQAAAEGPSRHRRTRHGAEGPSRHNRRRWPRHRLGRTGGAHKPTAAGVGPAKWDRLVSVDKSGPDTALAKLNIGYFVQDLALDPSAPPGDRMFTDYLHMIRVAGGWRIVARIYTAADATSPG